MIIKGSLICFKVFSLLGFHYISFLDVKINMLPMQDIIGHVQCQKYARKFILWQGNSNLIDIHGIMITVYI